MQRSSQLDCETIASAVLPLSQRVLHDEFLATITRGAWISHDLVGQNDGNIELLPPGTGRSFVQLQLTLKLG